MNGARFGLGEILASQIIRRAEFNPAGSPVVRFYRTRNSLFRFLRKRCGICHLPPSVLYYDSPQFGFICNECHTRAMGRRMESIRSQRGREEAR